jgi:hypothetical protein
VASDRWSNNWVAVGPPEAVRVALPSIGRRTADARRRIGELPAGSPIVMSATAPGAGYRCRAFAHKCGIVLDRSYLAFPSAARPAYLVEDAPASVGVFLRTVLVAPPRSRGSVVIGAALALLRALRAWRLIRLLAPGRLIVGRRL